MGGWVTLWAIMGVLIGLAVAGMIAWWRVR